MVLPTHDHLPRSYQARLTFQGWIPRPLSRDACHTAELVQLLTVARISQVPGSRLGETEPSLGKSGRMVLWVTLGRRDPKLQPQSWIFFHPEPRVSFQALPEDHG